jgi:hypothetical protein
MKNKKIIIAALVLSLAALLAACGGGGGGGGSNGGGGSGGSLLPVTDAHTAEIVVGDIEDAVTGGIKNHISPASTVNITVAGDQSGSATVYGKYTTSYCSYSTRTSIVIDIDVTFNNFGTMGKSTNAEKILNGTVNYQYYYNCDGSGGTYVQSKPIYGGSESPVQIQDIIDGGTWGYSDLMTFYGAGNSDTVTSGWATPSNGVTYNL